MTEHADVLALQVKEKNIIEMALGFTAMTRVFSQGSMVTVAERLGGMFANLGRISTRDDYEKMHADFCKWFIENIHTAKSGRTNPLSTCSYGQAAKVFDISAKVYVYYCAQPCPAAAERLIPMLHAAIDTPMMLDLAKRYTEDGIKAKTLQEVDQGLYEKLQSTAAKDAKANFQPSIHPVQYDDIVWRRLVDKLRHLT
jgi:hypothetical protein